MGLSFANLIRSTDVEGLPFSKPNPCQQEVSLFRIQTPQAKRKQNPRLRAGRMRTSSRGRGKIQEVIHSRCHERPRRPPVCQAPEGGRGDESDPGPARKESRLSQPARPRGWVQGDSGRAGGRHWGRGGLDLTWGAGAVPPELGGLMAVRAQ